LRSDQLSGGWEVFVGACGRIVADPWARPTDRDSSKTHPGVPVVFYRLSLAPDAPTRATVVIEHDNISQATGREIPSLPACVGVPPPGDPGAPSP
jgi:hypothetical protein